MRSLGRASDASHVLQRLSALRAETAPVWGRMSAPQMVCHLGDCFRMALRQKDVSPATGLLQRTLVKWVALYAPLRWPRGLRTRPEIDQAAGGGTRPAEFAADVAAVEALAARFVAERPALEGQAHPIFGRLSADEWLTWGYRHMDHHLRQFGV